MKTPMIFSALFLLQVACAHAAHSIYSIPLKDIDGESTLLKAYDGRVLLIFGLSVMDKYLL